MHIPAPALLHGDETSRRKRRPVERGDVDDGLARGNLLLLVVPHVIVHNNNYLICDRSRELC